MKKFIGIVLIVLALVVFVGMYFLAWKKGIYKNDFFSLLIDSVDVLTLVGALILAGILFCTE